MSARRGLPTVAPPAHYRIPDRVIERLAELAPVVVEAGKPLVRAAWNPASVMPTRVTRAYRFGPPAALLGPRGAMPFWWMYVAEKPMTAVFEAEFARRDARRQGTFYRDPAAEQVGLMARIVFARPLRLLDLTGDLSSQLSVYDEISSPDHEWCQWFGAHLDRLVFAAGAPFDGLRYPSRKHRNAAALALSSRALGRLRRGVHVEVARFADSHEFAELRAGPWRSPPPDT